MRKYTLVGVPGSGKSTHSVLHTCDSCAGQLVTREDDTPEALTTRIEDYRRDIDPVLELLRRKAPVFVVDASRDPDTVQDEIRTRLGLRSPHAPGGGPAGPGGQDG